MARTLWNAISNWPSGGELPIFDLRLENENIFFYGDRQQTANEIRKLTGVVVLMLDKPEKIRTANVYFQCHQKTQHYVNRSIGEICHSSVNPVENKICTMHQKVKLVDSNGMRIKKQTLQPGNHEFRFTFDIKGDVYESVEGMTTNYRVYDVQAYLSRTRARQFLATKHVHILRTISGDPTDFTIPHGVGKTLDGELKCSIDHSSKFQILGRPLTTRFEITPLTLKSKMTPTVTMWIEETRYIRTDPPPLTQGGMLPSGIERQPSTNAIGSHWIEAFEVYQSTQTIPQDCIENETDEEYLLPKSKFSLTWDLPTSVRNFRQSINDDGWIRIEHRCIYQIGYSTPEGESESDTERKYKIRMKMVFCIPPNMTLDDDGQISNQAGALTSQAFAPGPPPGYDRYALDQLYQEVVQSPLDTPRDVSTASTPDRAESYENLTSITAGWSSTASRDLQRRLEGLTVTPADSNLDSEALDRVPTYRTAVRTPLRSAVSDTPPVYDTSSRPPTPEIEAQRRRQLAPRSSESIDTSSP